MNAPVLELRGVSVRRRRHDILRQVSLSVRSGELWAIVGPNGAGKSTLLEALIGAAPISSGTVRLDSREPTAQSTRERARFLTLVGREEGRDLLLSVREVVALGRLPHLDVWGGMKREDLESVEQALIAADCGALAERPFATLSDGERQRVHFARALAQRPRVLLMDEATAHLDLAHRHETLQRVADFSRGGGAALVVVHDLDLAVRYASRVAVLDRGQLVASGDPKRVLGPERLRETFGVEAEICQSDRGTALHVYGPAGARKISAQDTSAS